MKFYNNISTAILLAHKPYVIFAKKLMSQNTKTKKKSRIRLLHQYYKFTGFYSFLGGSLKKALTPIVLFIIALLCVHYFVIDINDLLVKMTDTFPPFWVLTVFFISESILGLIPPEIFIAWSDKMPDPILYLSLIAVLSYTGGIISYFMGRASTRINAVHEYLEVKMAKHLKNARKWGGFLIVVGAILPVPFAVSSMAAGMIKYPFINYLLFGLLRFVRFAIYGAAIFNLV
ncbi:membrane protein YqaA with SNARE-associated domain [Leeuwenhoekiella polynyae]|uniref:Membrane protein YqaA with SNARE-associated domain n=2 Tax=Leeuwenhoekiella polynyae TaxID=1550906 RepID=A0A4Q0P107_9FLAO|nr:membrane protein YqaA with SNARE-associated domain [Leeuwenhoekiella polynyae]